MEIVDDPIDPKDPDGEDGVVEYIPILLKDDDEVSRPEKYSANDCLITYHAVHDLPSDDLWKCVYNAFNPT
ncbi:hypothetical protein N7527_006492 [Penicillium freii]|nr:hypothetical protein N7527_006492 [Penicillium freii]